MLYTMGRPVEQPLAKPVKVAAVAAKPKPRSPFPMPFDPEDLSKRLNAVLIQRQKAHAEMQRKMRAAAAATAAATATATATATTTAAVTVTAQQPAQAATSSHKDAPARPFNSKPRPNTHAAVAKEGRETSPNVPRTKQSSKSGHSLPSSQAAVQSSTSSRAKPDRKPSKHDPVKEESYHHVPQFAAAQFERTTTADGMAQRKLTHRLSHHAIGPHSTRSATGDLSGVSTIGGGGSSAPIKALRRVQSYRERSHEKTQPRRNERTCQFEATPEVEEDASSKPRHGVHRHTIEGHLGSRTRIDTEEKPRRMSTGDLLAKKSTGDSIFKEGPIVAEPEPIEPVDPETANEHRVDWTQSDETAKVRDGKTKDSPSRLRKVESIWTLRGRLGSFTKHGKESKVAEVRVPAEKSASATVSPKSPKIGFLACQDVPSAVESFRQRQGAY